MIKTSNKYSYYKLAWFPEKLLSFAIEAVASPIYVRIKPINRCCHNCFFCIYNASFAGMHETMDRRDMIPRSKMLEIINDLFEMDVRVVTFSGGGEPLLYPHIVEAMELLSDLCIGYSVLTNGQFLDEGRAGILYSSDWVRVSMDYHTPEMFAKTRRVSADLFKRICKNIGSFAVRKHDGCDLSVNYIITKENCSTLVEAAQFLKALGVDNVRFAPVWVSNFVEYHAPIKMAVKEQLQKIYATLVSDKFAVYDSYNIVNEVTHRSYNRCYVMQTIPAIGADLNVYPCHNRAYSADSVIGSIKDQSFQQMWFSEATSRYFKNFDCAKICTSQCANDAKNKFIHGALDGYGDDYV